MPLTAKAFFLLFFSGGGLGYVRQALCVPRCTPATVRPKSWAVECDSHCLLRDWETKLQPWRGLRKRFEATGEERYCFSGCGEWFTLIQFIDSSRPFPNPHRQRSLIMPWHRHVSCAWSVHFIGTKCDFFTGSFRVGESSKLNLKTLTHPLPRSIPWLPKAMSAWERWVKTM